MSDNYGIHSMAIYFVKAIHMITEVRRRKTKTSKETTAEEETTMEEVRDTSIDDLPIDIVNLIGLDLLARDRACFRAVNKTWRYSIPIAPHPHSFFQMTEIMAAKFSHMYTSNEGSLCRFYHPILNITYILDIPEIAAADSKIRYSKDGWLLMSQAPNHIFFINPITRKRIDLPDLPSTYNFRGVCFSSVPTSPNCIVFGIICTNVDSTHFCHIRRGQYTWTRYIGCNNKVNFVASHTNPVFHNGVFYCLGRNGKLATFELKQHGVVADSWFLTVLIKPEKPPVDSIRRNYLLADCNGDDIICVFEGHLGNSIEIFKMDYSMMTWRKVESLGDKMLFVSTNGSTTTRQVRGMENTIYFPRFHQKSSVFYSLKTSKFYTLGSGFCSDNFYDTTIRIDSTWIQPNFDTCPNGNFRWSSV